GVGLGVGRDDRQRRLRAGSRLARGRSFLEFSDLHVPARQTLVVVDEGSLHETESFVEARAHVGILALRRDELVENRRDRPIGAGSGGFSYFVLRTAPNVLDPFTTLADRHAFRMKQIGR